MNRHLNREQEEPGKNDFFEKVKMRFIKILKRWMPHRKVIVSTYVLIMIALAGICFVVIGKDMMPKLNNGQFQIRIKEPEGTRLERTEEKFKEVLQIINKTVNNHVEISSGYIGLVPSSFGSNPIYMCLIPGTHEVQSTSG